jgi:tripartite-type tricarboxylate transporter receptor subunit TctC
VLAFFHLTGMKIMRLFFWFFLSLQTLVAWAQTPSPAAWPQKPIRWVIPYTPGGLTDSVTRIVIQKMQENTGWTIVMDNKPGANSLLGAEVVAKSPSDGYTFLSVLAAHAANHSLYAGRLSFDLAKQLTPITLVGTTPLILTANNNFPAKDVKELMAYAKTHPNEISFGSSGIGSAAHLTSEYFKLQANVQMVHIPYKGTAPALQDLMGNNIQILVDTPVSLMPHVRAGKIKALAMLSGKRISSAPEVPTIAEAGGPWMESATWVMFLAPTGVPKDIINKLHQETAKALQSLELRERLDKLGLDPVGNAPEQAAIFLQDEINKWGRVIGAAGVKPE